MCYHKITDKYICWWRKYIRIRYPISENNFKHPLWQYFFFSRRSLDDPKSIPGYMIVSEKWSSRCLETFIFLLITLTTLVRFKITFFHVDLSHSGFNLCCSLVFIVWFFFLYPYFRYNLYMPIVIFHPPNFMHLYTFSAFFCFFLFYYSPCIFRLTLLLQLSFLFCDSFVILSYSHLFLSSSSLCVHYRAPNPLFPLPIFSALYVSFLVPTI